MARQDLKAHGLSWKKHIQFHLEHGWIISIPYLYAAGYFYEEEGNVICHLSYVNGDISTLFRFCLDYVFDTVEFQRHFSGRNIRYSFQAIARRFGHEH